MSSGNVVRRAASSFSQPKFGRMSGAALAAGLTGHVGIVSLGASGR
jgi:hypothetical protein